jgi:hypothetical protein
MDSFRHAIKARRRNGGKCPGGRAENAAARPAAAVRSGPR